MKWLLDTCFGDDLDNVKSALDKHNLEYVEHKFYDCVMADLSDHDTHDFFLYASLNMVKYFRSYHNMHQFCNLPQFKCSAYYYKFGTYMLNHRHFYIPFYYLKQYPSYALDGLNNMGQDPVFVRPDDGDKRFTGTLVEPSEWNDAMKYFERDPALTPETMCLVAEPKNIEAEYRVVTDGQRVISGCQYHDIYKRKNGPLPKYVEEWLNNILPTVDYQPDPLYVVDVCETDDDELRILECNSFSCSGFYSMDLVPVIDAWKNTMKEIL